MSGVYDDVRALGRRLSNWGRWGEDDERGTVNLQDPTSRLRGMAAARHGVVFSLGLPVGSEGPQGTWSPASPRTNPIHLMTALGDIAANDGYGGARFADDALFLPLQAGTQWDALGHAHYDDQLYNGHPASSIAVTGLGRNAIDKIADGVVGRGVLLDIARARAVEHLEAGSAVHGKELAEVLAAQGTELLPGDTVLVRTGWLGAFSSGRVTRAEFMAAEPGLALDCAGWVRDHDVAAVGIDNYGLEVVPSERPDHFYPLHMVLIRDVGLTVGELFVLDELAQDCARRGEYDFFFCGPPLRVAGGAGSPVNPLVIT